MQETKQSVPQQALSREFVLTGDSAAIGPTRDAIMDFVHEYCTDEQQEIDILLALQEGLANATVHGSRNDPSKLVRCTVEVSPSEFTFIIQDPGRGFDAVGSTDTAEDGTNLTEHGRGIFLMRSFMDEVSYRLHGTQLRLRKIRPQAH